MKLHIDFETRSEIDLKAEALDNYAKGKYTDILCMAFAFDDEEIQIWKRGQPFPFELACALEDKETVFAHNAAFEIAIWEHVGHQKLGWPKLPIELINCTMVMAYSMALPGSLEKVAPALGLNAVKDAAGSRIMLKLCKPREVLPDGTPIFWEYEDVPEQFEKLYEYCKQDVKVEREAEKRMTKLPDAERKLWLLDQKINARGIKIDIKSVKKAIEVIEHEKVRLNELVREVTSNAVSTYNAVAQMKDWMQVLYGVEMPKIVKKDKKTGEMKTTEGLDKDSVSKLLKQDIPEVCKRALRIRQEGSKSSTAKLVAMLNKSSSDERVRGSLQFMGAAATRRWAGRGLQIQNMTRPELKVEEIEKVIEILNGPGTVKHKREVIDMFYGQPTTAISDCLRSFIIAEDGNKLMCADYNSIEARVLAWLAGDESVLKVFRGHGKIYETEAANIFRIPMTEVTKQQRGVGKVAVLSLGFGGGVGAFQQMAKTYGVKMKDSEANAIKVTWRNAHKPIVDYWYQLENAAIMAVMRPGTTMQVGPEGRQVKYRVAGSFLWCQLPSKGLICYPYPKVEQVLTPWGEMKDAVTYMTEDATSHKWERNNIYGGFQAENITQSLSRDILAEALIRLEDNDYKITFSVHDEIICEVDKDFGSVSEMEKIMCVLPTWAKDLPISAEGGWEGKRYRK